MILTEKEKQKVKDYLEQVNKLRGRPSENKGLRNGRQVLQLIYKEDYTSKKGNKMLKVKWYNVETGANDFVYLMTTKKAYRNTINIKVGEVFECIVGGVGGFIQVTPIKAIDERPLPEPKKMCANHVITYDIEVFKYNWSFVFSDVLTSKKMKIRQDRPDLLEKFLIAHENDVFVGYNSIGYDRLIRKAIRDGKDPYKVSQEIINGDKSEGKAWEMFNNRIDALCEVDLYQDSRGYSLKEVLGFYGLPIIETSIPFDIDRPLREDEEEENLVYNTSDVDGTTAKFIKDIGSLMTKAQICELYDLDYTWLSKTNANVIAEVLKAIFHEDRGDQFDKYEAPEWIYFNNPEIERQVREWVLDKPELPRKWKTKRGEKVETTDLTFTIKLRDLEIKVGSGGLHGAVLNYIKRGTKIKQSDVGSLFPNTIVLNGYNSRNIPKKHVHLYSDILKDRMKYKHQGLKTKEQAMKLILNTLYGVLRAKFNKLYDPRQAILINLTGQMAMLDLADKIEPYAYISAMNTDSINYEAFDDECDAKIEEIKKDWCERSGYELDTDIIVDIAQANVNNYICRFEPDEDYPEGKIKTKGAVSMSGGLTWSKAVIMNAVKEYFTNGTLPEDYIPKIDDLRDFQIISKTGHTFQETRAYKENGEFDVIQKVNRSFAVLPNLYEEVKIRKVKFGVLEQPEGDPNLMNEKELKAYNHKLETFKNQVSELQKWNEELGEEAAWKKFQYEYCSLAAAIGNEPEHYTIANEGVDESHVKREDLDEQYYIDEAYRIIGQYEGTVELDEEDEGEEDE